jgi:DNA repair ATPase RecN
LQAKLEQLYQKWKQRLEIQEQEMAQKSMAASPDNANKVYNNIQRTNTRNEITKTAAWMEKAETLLTKETESNQMLQKDIEDEMKEIALLVEEAPAILAISSDLPKLLNSECNKTESTNIGLQTSIHKLNSCSDVRTLATESCTEYEQSITTATAGKRKYNLCDDENTTTDSPNNPMKLLASLSSQAAPIVTKDDGDGCESKETRVDDAKTFVNFLQSVVNK